MNDEAKKELEKIYGQVWDTTQLQGDFVVHSFLAPVVNVTRKSDNQIGSLQFQHMPRFYYNFISHPIG